MKRIDEGKVSLVEFLSSIQFARRSASEKQRKSTARFARFEQRAPVSQTFSTEDASLIRSAN